MADKYIFVNDPQEKTPIYEMSKEEFQKIEPANAKVFEVFHIEELFAMLVDNLYAFNNVIFTYADKARLKSVFSDNYFQKRLDVNRTALNFFAGLSLYQDFVRERIKAPEIADSLLQNREIQRCIAMRNYIQHVESFPVISCTSFSWCDLNVELSSVRFRVSTKDLKVDKLRKGTKKAFDKFFEEDEQIDLYEILNQGMGEVQLIQSQIRKLPLYEEYSQSKAFLLDIEKKITRRGISSISPCYYYESDDEQNWKTCFVAMDTIKFIDENISHYPCLSSSADKFITTAPTDFVDKCRRSFSPATRAATVKQIQKKK